MRAIKAPLPSTISQSPNHICCENLQWSDTIALTNTQNTWHIKLGIRHNLGTIAMLTGVNVGCSSLQSGVSVGDCTASVVVEMRFYVVLVGKD